MGAGMLGDLEEEGPGDGHPGEWIQNIPSLHSLQPVVSFPTAKLPNTDYQQPHLVLFILDFFMSFISLCNTYVSSFITTVESLSIVMYPT